MTLSRCVSSAILSMLLMAASPISLSGVGVFQDANSPQPRQFAIASIDWCPYICVDSPQKPGVLVEYVQKIFQGSDFQITFTHMPWARAIHETHTGKFLALLAPAKEEAPGLIYPNQSLGYQHMCMFTRSDDPWKYTGIQSLNGRRVVYAYGAYPASLEGAQEFTAFYPMPYNKTFVVRGVKMVMNRRTDTLLFTVYSTLDYLNREGLEKQMKNAGCVQQQAVYLAFSPHESHSNIVAELSSLLDMKVRELEKVNTFHELLKSYGLNPLQSDKL